MWRIRGTICAMDFLRRRLGFIVSTVVTALTVWLSTLLISGIHVGGDSTVKKVFTLLIVALIIGVINATLKPLIKGVGCLIYILTLGLIALVINALLLELTAWICDKLSLPFSIDNFWPSAVLGALFISIVSGILNTVFNDRITGKSN
jgi:putative membrane protein